LADIVLEGGEPVRAHCVNPGRMEGLVVPGARVWVSESPNPNRALRYTWELIELEGRLIGTNTGLPNRLVGLALEAGRISGLDDLETIQPEQPLGRNHRVDFVLHRRSGRHVVEVKNCHLVYSDGWGYFPDSNSERAVKHVEALTRLVKKGGRASVYFTVQRNDARGVRPSALHAPQFARALRAGARAGLEVRAFQFTPSLEGLDLGGELEVDVEPYELGPIRQWARALESTTGWVRKNGQWSGQALK
jgi:sugar fermentation stimulation protein A